MFKTTLSEYPLEVDPLGPMGMGPNADAYPPSDPLALDPLSPVESGARPVDAHGNGFSADAVLDLPCFTNAKVTT
jgi:hypothetical protein